MNERFWNKVRTGPACWEWTAGRYRSGYGQFRICTGKMGYAHRISWELMLGPIPDGSQVLHRCDNRLCVRPEHLFLGDNRANMLDKVSKGRQSRGESHGMAKLDLSQVRLIRAMVAGGAKHREAAARFGVSDATVSLIVNEKHWKVQHVDVVSES